MLPDSQDASLRGSSIPIAWLTPRRFDSIDIYRKSAVARPRKITPAGIFLKKWSPTGLGGRGCNDFARSRSMALRLPPVAAPTPMFEYELVDPVTPRTVVSHRLGCGPADQRQQAVEVLRRH